MCDEDEDTCGDTFYINPENLTTVPGPTKVIDIRGNYWKVN